MFVILRFLRPTPILDLLEQNTSRAVPLSFVTWATTVANHQCTTAQLATAAGHREHGAHRSTTANGIDLIYHPPFLLFWHSHPPNPRSPKKNSCINSPSLDSVTGGGRLAEPQKGVDRWGLEPRRATPAVDSARAGRAEKGRGRRAPGHSCGRRWASRQH